MSYKQPEGDGMINERITIRLPEEIIQKMDEIIKTRGYTNRSEYIRKLVMKDALEQEPQTEVVESEKTSRKITIEISSELYTFLFDRQSRGILHGSIEDYLSNIVEKAVRRALCEMEEEFRKERDILNRQDKVVI
jgi:Arc/MetJ-type ribon-helix-helix transcriptional regulator